MKHNVVLTIAYEGTAYYGWQKTSVGPSIEEILQHSLEKILQHPVVLQAASRTDRGVHAEGQCVNFFSENIPKDLLKRLNCLLPQTIRILRIKYMPEWFHPTLHAQKKEYHYHICQSLVQLPKERLFSWHVPYPLDLIKMHTASTYFLGEHDFSSFCNFRKNLNYRDKKRNVTSVEVILSSQNQILIVVTGVHFLYKMVRNIVGTLVDVGKGKILPHTIPTILNNLCRNGAGVTAPACGLTLKKIYYPQECKFEL